MAENTKIEWADDSVSFWWGCTHDGPGCLHCYAEKLSKRSGDFWGPRAPRLWIKSADDAFLRLNRKAERDGAPRIVFVNSMSDFFESHAGPVVTRNSKRLYRFEGLYKEFSPTADVCLPPITLDDLRADAFKVADQCDWLRLLLLTKRPENIRQMWAKKNVATQVSPTTVQYRWTDGVCRQNVWLGTSIATQADADRNVPLLRSCRDLSPVLFLSCEPLIEAVTLDMTDIDWVIVGGESGHGARPMHPDWARSIRDQCQRARVPFFFKQWGEWGPIRFDCDKANVNQNSTNIKAIEHDGNRRLLKRVGKKSAGRILDGREWSEFPKTAAGVIGGGDG